EDQGRRAASGSDYLLTGRLRCPKCGKTMLGTRATGRNRTYRYYTCWSRNRYNTGKCDFDRLDADAVDEAVVQALADFYRMHHRLIANTVGAARNRHRAKHGDRRAELDALDSQLTQTNQAIDRYLSAFESGKLDEDLVADRLATLQNKAKQLRQRREELTDALADEPAIPESASLDAVAEHVSAILTDGTHNQAKAIIEDLIASIDVATPSRLRPIFRIPLGAADSDHTGDTAAESATTGGVAVRVPTNKVRHQGLEPRTH
ncbi:MAG: zinc ribbon domain-containing protein, partial [Stackebrandtia sp.]